MTITRSLMAVSLAAMAVACAAPAMAADHKVEMRSQGTAGGFYVYEPAYLAIAPGDTVTFSPAQPGHDAASIPGMTPAGAEPFKGAKDEELKVTFTKPGLYGYECTPHYELGMVGVIVVGGKPANLAEAKAVEHPARAQAVMDGLLQKAAEQN